MANRTMVMEVYGLVELMNGRLASDMSMECRLERLPEELLDRLLVKYKRLEQ